MWNKSNAVANPFAATIVLTCCEIPFFAVDPHYKLAAGYMQLLLPANHRKLARFIMAKCERENVNEGEENAQFKAMHFTLLRCPGPGSCADPLMCAAA